MLDVNKLKFDEKGLIPAIVVDERTDKVLTLAYMNKESLAISMEKGLTCFYSRSRQELWLKGETSGNYQHIVSITADCDYDALVVRVNKDGPACHLGEDSCFHNPVFGEGGEKFKLEGLYDLLADRKATMPEGSYTTYLFQKGLDKILKKVGEESTLPTTSWCSWCRWALPWRISARSLQADTSLTIRSSRKKWYNTAGGCRISAPARCIDFLTADWDCSR